MRVTMLPDAEPRPRRIAVGEFDGVHLGHREVIRGNDTVLTFEPHPLRVVRPEAAPKLLTSLEAKAELIEALGVQELVVIPFDERFAHQSPREFIDHMLVGTLSATHVSVGENFRFGHRASGDPGMLMAERAFETRVVPLVEVDGEIVSSSHIRGARAGGRGRARSAVPRRAVSASRRGRDGRPAGSGARLPDGQHRSRRGARLPRAWRLRGTRRRGLRRGQRRRPADVRHRAGGARSRRTCSTRTSTSTGRC